jgi:acetylornithine/succinyldiaminopimelate/putrescine aminotransferase
MGRLSDVAPVLLEPVQASVGYIIVVSKGMASGLPISAAFTDDEVAAVWGPGARMGNRRDRAGSSRR